MTETAREGEDLVTEGGRIPHGTELRKTYHGNDFTAEVRDGQVVFRGDSYPSLTAAAVAAKKAAGAEEWLEAKVTANGWRFWKLQDPETGEWTHCLSLRTDR